MNRYDQEHFQVPAFQPAPNFCRYGSSDRLCQSRQLMNYRRHSSYSHEDILNMKYQAPPVDPRYRDSRPFVNSSSNIYDHGRRDFMSRRRSSSSLQEDILRPFQHQFALDRYLRKSNPVINRSSSPNLSDKSNKSSPRSSNWNLNPSIFIEEYNDNNNEVKSNNSSANLSLTEALHIQPLNEESVAPFAGVDEIPFIDDENEYLQQRVYVSEANAQANGEDDDIKCVHSVPSLPPPAPVAPTASAYMKNRKTVSFDLDCAEELNKLKQTNLINKSNTCDHIINVKLNDNGNAGTKINYHLSRLPKGTPQTTTLKSMSMSTKPKTNELHQQTLHSSSDEPIFKFCTLKKFNSNPNESTESFNETSTTKFTTAKAKTQRNATTNLDNDILSAYFYDDDDEDADEYNDDDQNDDIAEDQTMLRDKKFSSIQQPIIDTRAITLDLSELNSDSTTATLTTTTTTSTSSQNEANDDNANHRNERFAYIPNWKSSTFCDKIQYGNGKVRALKDYFEGLKMPSRNLSESSPDLSKKADKLTSSERQSVLDQLKEWSEFGTIAPKPNHPSTKKAVHSNPITHSVLNLTVTTSFNDKCHDAIERCASVPDVNNYILTEEMLLPEPMKRAPDAYVLRTNKISANIKSTHEIVKSCPNLCPNQTSKPYFVSKLQTNFYNTSPCHRSSYLTPRKLKQNQRLDKRQAKCCRGQGSSMEGSSFANRSDQTDETR